MGGTAKAVPYASQPSDARNMMPSTRLRVFLALLSSPCLTRRARDEALATYAFTKGWATFGLALPQGAARTAVQVGKLPTQTDVKVRWPDGSIRFAVVSANVPSAGSSAIVAANAPAGAMPAQRVPVVTVTLTIGGKPYVATLPATPTDLWLNGPLVSEGRAVVAPGGHPFLRVIFDLRSYAGGGSRVDVTVENCLDASDADEVTYDAVIAIGDKRVFEQAKVNHKYLAAAQVFCDRRAAGILLGGGHGAVCRGRAVPP